MLVQVKRVVIDLEIDLINLKILNIALEVVNFPDILFESLLWNARVQLLKSIKEILTIELAIDAVFLPEIVSQDNGIVDLLQSMHIDKSSDFDGDHFVFLFFQGLCGLGKHSSVQLEQTFSKLMIKRALSTVVQNDRNAYDKKKFTLFPEVVRNSVGLPEWVTSSEYFTKRCSKDSVDEGLAKNFGCQFIHSARIVDQDWFFHYAVAHHRVEDIDGGHVLVDSQLCVLQYLWLHGGRDYFRQKYKLMTFNCFINQKSFKLIYKLI